MLTGMPAREDGTWWTRRGIRARSTIAAVAVVAVAFLIGAVGLVSVVRVTMTNAIEQSVTQRVQDAAAQIASDDVDAVSAMAGASPGDATVVQVISATGTVLVVSPSIQGEAPITDAPPPQDGTVALQQLPLSFVDGDPYLVAVTSSISPQGPVTVAAAQSLVPVQRVTSTIVLAMLVVGPLLLLAVAAVTWFAVGSSLASVDRIRRRVDDIDASDLHERVPVPPAKDEVERLAVTMNRMLGRLEHAMTRQREFVGDASHELKTPLATMRASLDVSERSGGVSEDARRVLSEEVDRMTSLVSDLLTLARSDEGTRARRVEVDLDDVAAGEAAGCARLRPEVSVRLEGEPVRVLGDPGLLVRAVRNLVENAVRYATRQVVVRIGTQGAYATVVVEDDGPGIPAADRERVLERFVRLDEHRARQDGGTGLGLAIAAEVARAHGGSIEIGDTALGGAQVTLLLPREAGSTGSRR
jgi:signal transduction histidine kinase